MTTIRDIQLTLPEGSLTDRDLSALAQISPSKMAQRAFAEYPITPPSMRVWDNFSSGLPGTASADDMAISTGTPGTDAASIETGDVKGLDTTSRKFSFAFGIPANFDPNQTVQVRLTAGMKTTVADQSATVDVQAWKSLGDGSVGSDLCLTDAVSINSLTASNKTFEISSGSLEGGSVVIFVVTVTVQDLATTTEVNGKIYDVRMLVDTRG